MVCLKWIGSLRKVCETSSGQIYLLMWFPDSKFPIAAAAVAEISYNSSIPSDNLKSASSTLPELDTFFDQSFEDDTSWMMASIMRREIEKASSQMLTPIIVKKAIKIVTTALPPIISNQRFKSFVSPSDLQKSPIAIANNILAPIQRINQPVLKSLNSSPKCYHSLLDLYYKAGDFPETKQRCKKQTPGLILSLNGYLWSMPASNLQSMDSRAGKSYLTTLLYQAAWRELISSNSGSISNSSDSAYMRKKDRGILEAKRKLANLGSEPSSTNFDPVSETEKLALLYYKKGFYIEATTFYAQVAIVKRKVFGSKHPDTVRTYLDVVDAMIQAGEYQDAKKVHQIIHISISRYFSAQERLFLRSMILMANIYHGIGWDTEAENLERETLQISLNYFGIMDHYTITAMGNLAGTLKAKATHWDNLKDGLEVNDTALRLAIQLDQALGSKSLKACRHPQQLGKTLQYRGENVQSIELNKKLFRNSLRLYGSEHPVTLKTASELGRTLLKFGDYVKSESILRVVMLNIYNTFGAGYTELVYSLEDLAKSLVGLRHWEEATDTYEQLYQYYEKDYDIPHERESRCSEMLRNCYYQQGLYLKEHEFEDRLLCLVDRHGKAQLDFSIRVRKWCKVDNVGETADPWRRKRLCFSL